MRSLRTMSVAAIAASGLFVAASSATGNEGRESAGPERYRAALNAVPHDPAADGGSNAAGRAMLALRGDTVSVLLKGSGLSPELPHAVHIHGKDHPELSTCPGAERRIGGVSDSLIETVDGLADYGPITALGAPLEAELPVACGEIHEQR